MLTQGLAPPTVCGFRRCVRFSWGWGFKIFQDLCPLVIRKNEAYWVLFRFLYWGQFVDPCLIIAGNYLVGSSVSECLV